MPYAACKMCNEQFTARDTFARYCTPCMEYRRRNGMRREKHPCVTCKKDLFPMQRDLDDFFDPAKGRGMCSSCRYSDILASGGIVIIRVDEKGHEKTVAIPREKATMDEIYAFEKGQPLRRKSGLLRFDHADPLEGPV